VPRTRTGGGCWAKLTDVASSRAKPAAPSARRAIWFMSSSENLVAGETLDDRINNPSRLRLFPPLGGLL
jgi:hypothetical protein